MALERNGFCKNSEAKILNYAKWHYKKEMALVKIVFLKTKARTNFYKIISSKNVLFVNKTLKRTI